MNDLMRVGEAAQLLGLSESRLYVLIARGMIPSVKVAGRIRIPRAAYEAWLADQSRAALASVRNREADHAHAA